MEDGDHGESRLPLLPSATSARPRTAHEYVYESLREAILEGTLRGGDRLVLSSIAASHSVSSTPVRDALRDLAHEGLVVLDAGRGAEVRKIDFDEVADVYQIRELLEPLLVGWAAERITDGELDTLRELQEQMEAETDPRRWVPLNTRFHGVLANAARSPSLGGFTRALQAKAAIFVGSAMDFESGPANRAFWSAEVRKGNEEHSGILLACVRHDSAAAADLMKTHVRSTFENIVRSGRRYGIGDAGTTSRSTSSTAGR